MNKIKVGDQVMVLSGKDRGRQGKVIEMIPKESKLVVEGVNITKRHIRPTRRGQESGIVEREAPVYVSNVIIICPRCGKRTRVGMKIVKKALKKEEKLRFCKKCGEIID
jgi:large subunit ribosomal protein L24